MTKTIMNGDCKMAKKKDGPGRPLKEINWDMVDKALHIQCTGEEIADMLFIDYDTLVNACKRDKNSNFSDYSKKKRAGGKASLRRMQWKRAEAGSDTMLIWLGKNTLGQVDKPVMEEDDKPKTVKIVIEDARN